MIAFWIGLALFFLCLELASPGLLYFLSVVSGCLCAALLAWYNVSIEEQCVYGGLAMVISALIVHGIVKRWMRVKTPLLHQFSYHHLLGKPAVITRQYEQMFYVYIENQWWMVKSVQNKQLAVGKNVLVVGMQGCHLQVDLIEE